MIIQRELINEKKKKDFHTFIHELKNYFPYSAEELWLHFFFFVKMGDTRATLSMFLSLVYDANILSTHYSNMFTAFITYQTNQQLVLPSYRHRNIKYQGYDRMVNFQQMWAKISPGKKRCDDFWTSNWLNSSQSVSVRISWEKQATRSVETTQKKLIFSCSWGNISRYLKITKLVLSW